ncbi:MAG TPA: hypothetical protein VNJ29_00280, partial [Candidatus Nitrosotenuis sp.]|nr:hypothetical protein [Candidatus Nitrosotenuis sp.]
MNKRTFTYFSNENVKDCHGLRPRNDVIASEARQSRFVIFIRKWPIALPLIILTIFSTLNSPVQAGPWTQANKSAQLIMKISWYDKKKDFSNNHRLISSNRFDKYEFSPYLEYGLTDDLTIGGQLYVDHLVSQSSGTRHKETGLADSDLFARYQLYKNTCHVISLQGLVKIPGPYNKKHNPSLGAKQVDLEPR